MAHIPSPFLIPPKPMPMTIERVEAALDKLATIMVGLGDEGVKLLPLYESIEGDLATMKAGDDRMAAVCERARRAKEQANSMPKDAHR